MVNTQLQLSQKTMTKTMRERFIEHINSYENGAELSDVLESIEDFIEQELKKERELKDQEHKAELEMIKGEIEARLVFINKIDGGVVSELFAEAFNDGIKSTISILDSHINKPYEQQRHKTE